MGLRLTSFKSRLASCWHLLLLAMVVGAGLATLQAWILNYRNSQIILALWPFYGFLGMVFLVKSHPKSRWLWALSLIAFSQLLFLPLADHLVSNYLMDAAKAYCQAMVEEAQRQHLGGTTTPERIDISGLQVPGQERPLLLRPGYSARYPFRATYINNEDEQYYSFAFAIPCGGRCCCDGGFDGKSWHWEGLMD